MATRPTGWRRDKHVYFPHRLQRHSATFELAMIVLCIACIVIAVIIAKATDWGVTTRP
jgi:hypothetical protein